MAMPIDLGHDRICSSVELKLESGLNDGAKLRAVISGTYTKPGLQMPGRAWFNSIPKPFTVTVPAFARLYQGDGVSSGM
jgi:hypothetical protein